MSHPIKAFYVQKSSNHNIEARPLSEPKQKPAKQPIPLNQYLRLRADKESHRPNINAIDKLKLKLTETQTQWSGLMAKTISLENNLIQLRDSVSHSLKNRGESVTQDRFSSNSSKSTNHPEIPKSHSGPVKQDLNNSFYNLSIKPSQLTPQVQKVNMTSRIASPMISKKAVSFKTMQKAPEVPLTMTLSRIQFDSKFQESKFQQSFLNKTSMSWFPKSHRFTQFESLPQFNIGKVLGKGQFSEVYTCIDKLSGLVFALKVIKKEKIQDPQLQNQLVQEITIQSKLDHPNIIKLYNFYSDDKNIYLLQEYCNEGELFKVQRKQPLQKFSENVAAQYIEQIARCLLYMHQMNIMHRDIKTENIMLSFNQIKLGDFGCVCSNSGRRDTFCGTIEFMAPEVIKLEGYDKRVDAWQIAVLAYELVHGSTPFVQFGSRDQQAIMQNILKNLIIIPHYFSTELQLFIKGGLQQDPNKRLTIAQMIQHPWILKYRNKQKCDLSLIL